MTTPTHIDTEAQRLRTDRRDALLAALDLHHGDRRLAAAALGIRPRTIFRWQRAYTADGELEARARAQGWPSFADHGRAGMTSRWGRAAAPVPTDAERLTAALRRTGLTPWAANDAAGVAKGTTRLVLTGGVKLASAGGGRLLAWVEGIEAGERSGGT